MPLAGPAVTSESGPRTAVHDDAGEGSPMTAKTRRPYVRPCIRTQSSTGLAPLLMVSPPGICCDGPPAPDENGNCLLTGAPPPPSC